MLSRSRKPLAWALGLLLLGGCCFPVREHTDEAVDHLAGQTIDLEPLLPPDTSTAEPPPEKQEAPQEGEKFRAKRPLDVPRQLPGARIPPIRMPDPKDPEFEKKKAQLFKKLFPNLPPQGADPQPLPGPNGKPLTLADLQRLALANSPLIRQAAADVQANRGALIKAGAYPNPTMGYEEDTAFTTGGPGYQGGFIDQVIKTGGKLKLQMAAAQMDLLNSQLALRRAQTDLTAQVRSGYFAVLVALENIRVNRALIELADRTTALYALITQAGPAAQAPPYEPLQMRVLAYQARANLVQARNRYVSAWKQLAATLGLPGLPPTQLAGRVDLPIPVFNYDRVLARVLSRHTDVGTAENGIRRARYSLRLAQVTPIPDIEVRLIIQKDFTGPPFNVVHGLQVGGPIPIWDSNKGGVIQAQGQLLRAIEESHRVRDDLTQRLADAFERYQTNLRQLAYYRDQILPDQIQATRGVFERFHAEPDKIAFADIFTAQQTLLGVYATYLGTLALQWQAVVDVASLLQTNDLFQIGEEVPEQQCAAPLPDLEALLRLPCCHPSNPLPDPSLKGADPHWPIAAPPAAPAQYSGTTGGSAPANPPTHLPPPEAVLRKRENDPGGAELLSPETNTARRAEPLASPKNDAPEAELLRPEKPEVP
jgi:cobalt-zinc-cadmium efflux system outer membrane protein